MRRHLLTSAGKKESETLSPVVLQQSSEPTNHNGLPCQHKGHNPALIAIKDYDIRLTDSGLSSSTEDIYYASDSSTMRSFHELDDIMEEQTYNNKSNQHRFNKKSMKLRTPISEFHRKEGFNFHKSSSSPNFNVDSIEQEFLGKRRIGPRLSDVSEKDIKLISETFNNRGGRMRYFDSYSSIDGNYINFEKKYHTLHKRRSVIPNSCTVYNYKM